MTNSTTDDKEGLADISVIMSAYQAAGSIERALESISGQSLKPREVIVVDDGSSDGTFECAKNFKANMGGIELKVIRQENAGAGAARNNAVAHATAKYLAFLDADDEWLPTKIEESVKRLHGSETLLVAHNIWTVHGDSETLIDSAGLFKAASSSPYIGLYRRGFIATSTVVTHRQAVVDLGAFDEGLPVGQDFDLWLKLLQSPGTKFEIFDQPLTRYHISPNSITSQTEARLRSTLRIALRHAPSLRQHSLFPLASLWFRILAVHWEAMSTYWNNRNFVSWIFTVLRLPINTISLTRKYFGA